MQRQALVAALLPLPPLFRSFCKALPSLTPSPRPSLSQTQHSAAMNMQQQPQSRQRGASCLLAAAALIGTAQAFLLPFNTPAQPQASLAKSSGGLWWQQQQQQAGVRMKTKEVEEGGGARGGEAHACPFTQKVSRVHVAAPPPSHSHEPSSLVHACTFLLLRSSPMSSTYFKMNPPPPPPPPHPPSLPSLPPTTEHQAPSRPRRAPTLRLRHPGRFHCLDRSRDRCP